MYRSNELFLREASPVPSYPSCSFYRELAAQLRATANATRASIRKAQSAKVVAIQRPAMRVAVVAHRAAA